MEETIVDSASLADKLLTIELIGLQMRDFTIYFNLTFTNVSTNTSNEQILEEIRRHFRQDSDDVTLDVEDTLREVSQYSSGYVEEASSVVDLECGPDGMTLRVPITANLSGLSINQ